jgi:CheY-like chemotaxis protein
MMIQNCKILVVDDNDSIRQLLMTKLRSCGFDVICAESGLDAIQKFNNESFDLVLTDLSMPVINGKVLSQYIRNLNNDVPVIGITGEPWLAGDYFNSVIEKPFELKFVMDTIEYFLMEKPKRAQHHKQRACGYKQDDQENVAANFSSSVWL